VVATATLALQHQLVERDIPRLVEAVGASEFKGAVDTSYAVLKGRSNYVCLHRIREGVPNDQGALVEVPQGSMAKKVLDLRSWAEKEAGSGGSGERDHAPRHTDREWRQVSVNHREWRDALPVRSGVLRRGGPRAGPPVPPDRHQPLAARDRRDRGRTDDP
jgi:ATP-dependent DNA helicase DinG